MRRAIVQRCDQSALRQPTRRPKLAERVAEAIIAEIRSNDWPPGTLIGTEPQLVARLGVSRATLLEAIRQVERHGAAEMRRGGHGGLVVSRPVSRAVARVLSNYLEFSDVTLQEQLEATRILETLAAGLAALTADEQTVERLRDMVSQATAVESYLALSRQGLRLTTAIAQASGNPALALFVRTLVHVRSDYFQRGSRRDRPISEAMNRFVGRLSTLVEAIAGGDAGRAEQLTQAHRDALHRQLEERFANLAGTSPLITAVMRRHQANEPAKRAEVLAFQIRDQIIAEGWPVGQKIGEEASLRQQYNVSRWVFRQAIRMLEPHRIVEVRRGNRGGLMIGKPDPSYTIALAASYLEAEKLSFQHAFDVWSVLLENAAQLAAERLDPERVDQEEAALFLKEIKIRLQSVEHFEEVLLELSANRALALFAGVLSRYLSRAGVMSERLKGDALGRVSEAMLLSDGPLARRRLRDHLRIVRAAMLQ